MDSTNHKLDGRPVRLFISSRCLPDILQSSVCSATRTSKPMSCKVRSDLRQSCRRIPPGVGLSLLPRTPRVTGQEWHHESSHSHFDPCKILVQPSGINFTTVPPSRQAVSAHASRSVSPSRVQNVAPPPTNRQCLRLIVQANLSKPVVVGADGNHHQSQSGMDTTPEMLVSL